MSQPVSPFSEFPDFPNLTDRQLAQLSLYQMLEIRASLNVISTLLVAHNKVPPERFDKLYSDAHRIALEDIAKQAKDIAAGPHHPDQN